MIPPAVLLDTHALLWVLGEPKKLSEEIRQSFSRAESRLLVSSGTLFELSIKVNIGKLKVPEGFFDRIFEAGFERLPIADVHLKQYRILPLHHRDPFDRLIIAQSIVENIPVITSDHIFKAYDVKTLW